MESRLKRTAELASVLTLVPTSGPDKSWPPSSELTFGGVPRLVLPLQLPPDADASGLPPRLMAVPIVQSLPGGNGNATITAFAWFYATSATNHGNKLTINGQWVNLQLPATGQTTPYQPGVQGQILAVELTQ